MAEQAWFPSQEAGGVNGFGGAPPPPPPPLPGKTAYELRPLTTGELLDRTFYLYRSNFWLFVGLASIAAAVQVLAGMAQLVYMHYTGTGAAALGQAGAARGAGPGADMFQSLGTVAISMLSSLVYLAVYGVTQAATTAAVAAIYLGDPTSMGKALSQVKGRWFRFVLISLWQIWSSMWLFLVLFIGAAVAAGVMGAVGRAAANLAVLIGLTMGVAAIAGLAYGLIAYIRNSFAVPAAVMEGLKVRQAMRRSKQLTSGTKWRVFLLFLFLLVLYSVAAAVQSPLAIFVLKAKGAQQLLLQAISLFVGFFTSSVVGPVGAIGLCLFYIDQRIRKEGFDIEYMIERSGLAPPPPFAPPLPESQAATAPAGELP